MFWLFRFYYSASVNNEVWSNKTFSRFIRNIKQYFYFFFNLSARRYEWSVSVTVCNHTTQRDKRRVLKSFPMIRTILYHIWSLCTQKIKFFFLLKYNSCSIRKSHRIIITILSGRQIAKIYKYHKYHRDYRGAGYLLAVEYIIKMWTNDQCRFTRSSVDVFTTCCRDFGESRPFFFFFVPQP